MVQVLESQVNFNFGLVRRLKVRNLNPRVGRICQTGGFRGQEGGTLIHDKSGVIVEGGFVDDGTVRVHDKPFDGVHVLGVGMLPLDSGLGTALDPRGGIGLCHKGNLSAMVFCWKNIKRVKIIKIFHQSVYLFIFSYFCFSLN